MIRKMNTMAWGIMFSGLTLALTLTGCPGKQGQQSPKAEARGPKLVVGIVVDQMRYDYLARFWDNFGDGGFKRLVGEGTAFSNCNYNYVPTETAPGHASIFTGTTPSGHGIIMNSWLDHSSIAAGKVHAHSSVVDTLYPCLGIAPRRAKAKGASPTRLEASTIADQLKAATAGKAITIGVSLKDRSAILPVGKSADAAFWFDGVTGHMVSSTYYPAMKAGFPAWVDSLNALKLPRNYLSDPLGWNLLLPASEYAATDGPDDSRYEGTYTRTGSPHFPHHFQVDSLNCCAEFMTTAWGNLFLKDFAKQVVTHYGLGSDAVTDFLSLSFSATDVVAHQFGPQSREVEDTYLRLDRDLADFLNFLDLRLGKGNVLIFLTADHGGAANPTYAVDHGEKGGWIDVDALHQRIRSQLGDRKGLDSLLVSVQGHNIYLNRQLANERDMNLDSLRKAVVAAMEGVPGILHAYTAPEIMALQPTTIEETFLKNGFHPARSGDVLYTANYGYMQAPYDPSETWRYQKGTSHGTHYEYDTHVPLLFWGWGIPQGQSATQVVIPDIAPTVCKLLDIAAPDKCTGHAVGIGK